MSEQITRVRVAPSPTGDPHVGTAYQALFNYAFAKSKGGQFILRIEDTDQARSTKAAEEAILESLRWLGLEWDEGPDIGGPFAPYRQSERLEIYREHVLQLLEAGHAYRCFCTRDRLEAMRAENLQRKTFSGYDRLCRAIAPDESERRAVGGETFVVRMKIPLSGECVTQDFLRGSIRKEWESIDDQIILKSDQFPTYHLANVVDDHLMGITHVIRGEEWINSVPKHIKLYEYFGWEPPTFCHLPLLRNNDTTRSKLSKRKNVTSLRYFRRAGFLPEALVNFLGLIGGVQGDGDDKFSLQQFVQNFHLEGVRLGGPVFDLRKLRWLNGRYIRENYDAPALRKALETWAMGPEMIERIIMLAQPRLETLSDWGYLTAFFFADTVPIEAGQLNLKGKTQEELKELLQLAIWRFEHTSDFTSPVIEAIFRELAAALKINFRDLILPFYLSLTGSEASTPLFPSMEILGPDLVKMRLRRALELLGGMSEKQLKVVDKFYKSYFDRQQLI